MADNVSSMQQPKIGDSVSSFAAEDSFRRLDFNTPGYTTSTKDSQKEDVCQETFGSIDKFLSSMPSSPSVSVRLKKLGCALREILLPMSSNLETTKLLRGSPAKSSPQDKDLAERTPSMCALAESPGNWTPLAKFHSSSHFVQNTLVREYIDILNRGTREELLALKGIGEKRADYLLELREVSEVTTYELDAL